MKHTFDSAYKYIFSNKRIFYELITSFVDEEFIKNVTPDDITLLDRSFVTDEFLQRESDLIYKVKLEDHEVYIYFLLEFQSTVDKSIPVRMLLYILQFYDLLMRNSQKGKLPAVFPILLYNGTANWTVPQNIADLIDRQIPAIYIPSFSYYKIIEKNIPDEVLLKIHNLASAIIYLEKCKDEAKLKEAIGEVIELIKNERIIDSNDMAQHVIKLKHFA